MHALAYTDDLHAERLCAPRGGGADMPGANHTDRLVAKLLAVQFALGFLALVLESLR